MEIHHESGGEEAPPDLKHLSRICAELNQRGVRYVLIGGFAVILHGYPRFTYDIDFLIDTAIDNERAALDALLCLPDGAARQVRPGEVGEYGVVRIRDAVTVDLMKSACEVTYRDAATDAVRMDVHGVPAVTASLPTLWRTKQTLREKDGGDRVFIRERMEQMGMALDPTPAKLPPHPDEDLPPWLRRVFDLLRRIFRKK